MAGTKFSAFTTGATTANTLIVGYDSVAGTNNQYTLAQLAAGLPVTTLYGADGTIGTTRKALITDTIQFRNAGDTSDILSLNSDGKFALGLGAAVTSNTSIAIGNGTTVTPATSVGIGCDPITSGMNTGVVAIGVDSGVAGAQCVAIGAYAIAPGGGIAIGQGAGQKPGAYSMNIGWGARGEGANSITFNSSGASLAEPTTANAFGVYMTSNTTPDLEVVGGGESTLNTSLKITGQGYTELHAQTSNDLQFNWNDSNVQTATGLTGSHTFTASNPKAGATYILTLAQTGTVTATWTGVKWPGGTAPTLSGSGKTDVVTLICYDATGAGLYYGSATLDLA